MQNNSVFSTIIASSGFSPIKGRKQILTEDMWKKFHKELKIDYKKYFGIVKETMDKYYSHNQRDSCPSCADSISHQKILPKK